MTDCLVDIFVDSLAILLTSCSVQDFRTVLNSFPFYCRHVGAGYLSCQRLHSGNQQIETCFWRRSVVSLLPFCSAALKGRCPVGHCAGAQFYIYVCMSIYSFIRPQERSQVGEWRWRPRDHGNTKDFLPRVTSPAFYGFALSKNRTR